MPSVKEEGILWSRSPRPLHECRRKAKESPSPKAAVTPLKRIFFPILLISLWALSLPAHGFFTWTDERGVKHFSDAPPPIEDQHQLDVREAGGRGHKPEPSGVETRTKKNFLWSMATNRNTLYLLGSLHVLTSDSYPLAKEIERAYDDSQKVVFEADLDALNDPIMQAKTMALGLYPLDQTLRQNISEETYRALEKKVVEAGLSMAAFDHLRPWACALTLAVTALQRLGFDQTHGIDTYFFHKAKKDGKEKIFLEAVEYQVNLFANMGKGEQELCLRQALDDLEVIETMASDMVDAWKTGDVPKLDAIINKSLKKYPHIHDRLLVQRNKNWVSQIENLMNQDDNVLVIVGAAHLVGTQSLLDLFRGKGHTVTQR